MRAEFDKNKSIVSGLRLYVVDYFLAFVANSVIT